jgi:flagellar hook-length control protein FliK
MNLGELKLQSSFFNSQLQLNNEMLSNSTSTGFEAVMKNTKDHSDVEVGPKYKGLNNSTMDRYAKDKINNDREQFDQRRDVTELKESIREKIAQKRMEKGTGKGQGEALEAKAEQLEKLQERIENLEKAIREEIGLPEDIEAMEMLASLMNISVEQLVLQLTSGDMEISTEALVENLVEMITSEEVNTDLVVKELLAIPELMTEEKVQEFEAVLNEVIEKLPEEQQKMLEPVMEKVESVVEKSTEVEPTVTVENEKTELAKVNQSQVTDTSTKEAEAVKVEVQPKEEAPKQEMETRDSKPEVRLINKTEEQPNKIDFEEQVNFMKSESAIISTSKVSPKGVVARSVMNQVIQGTKMSINLSDQGSEILIKLNPKNLGNVALKMAFDKGVLLAEIQVENQAVKSIIESNLEDLRNSLKQEGYNIGDLDVSVNKDNSDHEEQRGYSGQKRKVKVETFEEVEEKVNQQNLVNEKAVNYLA